MSLTRAALAAGELPLVLAGPILRRADVNGIYVWLATSRRPSYVSGEVRRPPTYGVIGRSEPDVRAVHGFGGRLFITLLRIAPIDGEFPRGVVLVYDITIEGRRLGDMFVASEIAYPGFALPSFVLAVEGGGLNLVHGSCRKLHGRGEDAMTLIDAELKRTADRPALRPSLLCLTGDQIYADDVAEPLVGHIRALEEALGLVERLPDGSPSWSLTCGRVERLMKAPGRGTVGEKDVTKPGLTSTEMRNQALSFGQFVALYLLAWGPALWPGEAGLSAPTCRAAPAERGKVKAQLEALKDAENSAAAVQRVLANVPCYMICDDHEVSDDWNIDAIWHARVQNNAFMQRLAANALAAFWCFQAWGNDPERFGGRLDTVREHLRVPSAGTSAATLVGYEWSFVTPEGVVFADTRTRRSFDASEPKKPGGLLDAAAAASLTKALAGTPRKAPAMLVLPAPAYGPPAVELVQQGEVVLTGVGYKTDAEGWSAQHGHDTLTEVFTKAGVQSVLLLSGDVHFAYVSRVMSGMVPTVQFTSSSLKNQPSRAECELLARWISGRKDGLALGLEVESFDRAAFVQLFRMALAKPQALFKVVVSMRDVIEAPTGTSEAWVRGENNIGVVRQRAGVLDLQIRRMEGGNVAYRYDPRTLLRLR